MGPFVGIIIAIIWFIYSAINKSKKEQQKKQSSKPVVTTSDPENKPQTFKEIFDEMRKQVREAQNSENKTPPVIYAPQKTQRTISNKSVIVQDRDLVSEEESRDANEYKKFVEMQRKKKYVFVSDSTADDPQVSEMKEDDITPLDYEFELKNIILTDLIMRRPEY